MDTYFYFEWSTQSCLASNSRTYFIVHTLHKTHIVFRDVLSPSSLMDVTISPIVGKSILQSSNESLLQSADKETRSPDEALGSKSIPAFTMNETQFGKSVLHSIDSTANTSIPDDKKMDEIDETSPNVAMKSLPAFTLNETYFQKSVLRSYQSSIGEEISFEQSVETSKVEEVFVATPSPSTTLNVTNLNKSVLGSYGTSLTDSSTEKSKKDDAIGPNEDLFAENVDKASKKDKDRQEEASKLVSSLLTNDSDSDIQEAVIQKEKAQIVEIEREIHEIEGDMSNEDDDEDGDSGDESGDESGSGSNDESGDESEED